LFDYQDILNRREAQSEILSQAAAETVMAINNFYDDMKKKGQEPPIPREWTQTISSIAIGALGTGTIHPGNIGNAISTYFLTRTGLNLDNRTQSTTDQTNTVTTTQTTGIAEIHEHLNALNK